MRRLRAAAVLVAAFNLVLGVMLLSTTWNKAFGGTGGEDALLFQLVSYALLGLIGVGTAAVVLAIRPRRGIAAVVAAGMFTVGILLTLFTLFLIGLPEIALAVILLLARPKLPASKRRGPPRGAFLGAAGFNLFLGGLGFYAVGVPALTGTAGGGLTTALFGLSLVVLLVGVLAAALAVRPSRAPTLVLGVSLVASGAAIPMILSPLLPLGLVEVALGGLVLLSWRRLQAMPGTPVPPPGPSRTR